MNTAAIIYSHSITARLQYLVDFLAKYYAVEFKLTSNEDTYTGSTSACKINYSYHKITDDEIWMHPHVLLFESAVHPVKIECFQHQSTDANLDLYTCFFKAEGHLHFDLFAAIFYLITRYEEYLPHQKDLYGRYAHENATAFKENFLQLPLVNIWLEDFRNLLATKNNLFPQQHATFRHLPTYDIDMAWSFKNKGWKRNTGGLLKLLATGKWKSFGHRLSVLRYKIPDPYDAFQWMDTLHKDFDLHPLYFFLVAKKNSVLDKNINPAHEIFQQLIKNIAPKYTVGLHPSWSSNQHPHLLAEEKNYLQTVAAQTIHSSRQHFIYLTLPETYRRLIDAGITNDYSMGYGSINGFRASIATPYYWYDLKKDEPTNLLIHPFCFMDANSFYEQKLTAEEALNELMHYRKVITSVGGTMVTIWHNSFLGTGEEFEGWREVYRRFVSTSPPAPSPTALARGEV